MRKQTDRLLNNEIVEDLKDQIANESKKRSDAVARLKACASEATREADVTTRFFRAARAASEETKHVNGALEAAQLEALAQRKNSLARLKKTTAQAVQTIRETVFLDPEELKRRIEDVDLAPHED